ncbi:olfactory receptor 5V1-like [Dendrobates tinctorius]|uniref:olfactory receptor 5V1-like n=1 Tax=Dendrobates tinctorius TaxID=92724 RepID=UPI003CC98D87
MENHTFNFFTLTFSTLASNRSILSVIFTLIYLTGVMVNFTIVIVIYWDRHLHTPMYLFLSNLSFIDICYTTTTVPNLIHMLRSGNYKLSFIQCFAQLYVFSHVVTTEDLLLFIMAYDRYVAICNPLRYHSILSKKNCILFMTAIWVFGGFNSILATLTTSIVPMCYSNTIAQFFCELKAFAKISCPNAGFQLLAYMEVICGVSLFLTSIISYIKVIIVILHIRSKDGRRKAFSTCSSHLIVLSMYYGAWTSEYIMPPFRQTQVFELTLSIWYAAITPMLNPLIYSVRNKDVKRALLKMMGGKVRNE